MQKKGQINSEVLVYVLTVVIVGFVVVMGYRYISQTKNAVNTGDLLALQSKIANDIKTIGRESDTMKRVSYTAPANLNEMCVVDLGQSDAVLNSKVVDNYPLMKDSISSGTKKNVFFFGPTASQSALIPGIFIGHYPAFSCFKPVNGQISFVMRGLGANSVQLMADFVRSVNARQGAYYTLTSADEVITLSIPKDSLSQDTKISIEVIPPQQSNDPNAVLSDTYRFTADPNGRFEKPIEMSVRFDPRIECRDDMKMYFNMDVAGTPVKLESRQVDCEKWIAKFSLAQI